MSNGTIQPTTLVGIKRLAVSLKRDLKIAHLAALDQAAMRAGFENFRHAQNALPPETLQPKGVAVFLTVYWRDRHSEASGRETLEHRLNVPWEDLVTPTQMKAHRAFIGFQAMASDHLVYRWVSASSGEARGHICALARTLDFMDATRLRPSRSSSRIYPKGSSENSPPGQDHASSWYDPKSKRFLLADEPYEPSVERSRAERAQWAEQFQWVHAKPDWPGMYNPDGGSRLYLFSAREDGVPLEPLVEALNRLPAPPVASKWTGTSAPRTPHFISPGASLKPAPKPAAKRDQPAAPRSSSLSYHQTLVKAVQYRPNGKMPIAEHQRVGALLKEVLAHSRPRKGVHSRINTARSDLEEWLHREHRNPPMSNDEFLDVYYREGGSVVSKMIEPEAKVRQLANLKEVQRTLAAHYPDSKALRGMLRTMDAAVKSMETWGA